MLESTRLVLARTAQLGGINRLLVLIHVLLVPPELMGRATSVLSAQPVGFKVLLVRVSAHSAYCQELELAPLARPFVSSVQLERSVSTEFAWIVRPERSKTSWDKLSVSRVSLEK